MTPEQRFPIYAAFLITLFFVLLFTTTGCGGIEKTPCYLRGENCNPGAVDNKRTLPEPPPPILVVGPQGPKGDSGESIVGPVGATGQNGAGCTVEETEEGGLILCGDGSEVLIRHGEDGQVGAQGPSGEKGDPGLPGTPGSTLEPIVPCPDLPGAYPEVLWCIDDRLYAVFIGNDIRQIRNAEIPPGTYQTTDNRSCSFTVIGGCELDY